MRVAAGPVRHNRHAAVLGAIFGLRSVAFFCIALLLISHGIRQAKRSIDVLRGVELAAAKPRHSSSRERVALEMRQVQLGET